MALNGTAEGRFGYNSVVKTGLLANANHLKSMAPPIGTIMFWWKSITGTPSLPDGWVECDGTAISDSDSPMNGQTLPDFNTDVETAQGGRFVRGATTSGTSQDDQNLSHTHRYVQPDSTDEVNEIGSINCWDTWDNSATTSSQGGDEMRPNNMSCVMIMRIK